MSAKKIRKKAKIILNALGCSAGELSILLAGDEEIRELTDPVFQGVEWLSVRPRIRTAPRVVRPGPVD